MTEEREQHPRSGTDRATLSGFGNALSSEAVAGTLPRRQNSPQRVAGGLYAEQLSGTAFTAPRARNRRTWLYRIRPSAIHGPFERYDHAGIASGPLTGAGPPDPNQLRWEPIPAPDGAVDFVDGLLTYAVAGDVSGRTGGAVHGYVATASMGRRAFYSADGHLLIVPQEGALIVRTELGVLDVAPGEIALIPRGMKFAVDLVGAVARGYVGEAYGAAFELPDRGPIGGNSLASARHFLAPTAAFEDSDAAHELVAKFHGHLWHASLGHSPFDVVAWHGNYAPYTYDLANFQTINTVDFDHPDPSIFTVLTSPSAVPGTAEVDFVIFPPRWMVAEGTFRPPYYHRNVMSEFMGLIHGDYDAKVGGGFVPGGASLHNCMSAHGPDAATFEQASAATLGPTRVVDTLAFMFETSLPFHPTPQALGAPWRQADYLTCWQGLPKLWSS